MLHPGLLERSIIAHVKELQGSEQRELFRDGILRMTMHLTQEEIDVRVKKP